MCGVLYLFVCRSELLTKCLLTAANSRQSCGHQNVAINTDVQVLSAKYQFQHGRRACGAGAILEKCILEDTMNMVH